MTSFEQLELDESIIQAVSEAGYKAPTTIQKMVIPHAMEAQDILGSAPTGTGKTAAFLLPALQHLLDFPRSKNALGVRVLIMAPTRELAVQIYDNALLYSKYTEFKCGLVTGGINYGSHKELLETKVDLLVATPGRLLEYIEEEKFDCRDIEWLILDEADRMLDMGFRGTMQRVADESINRKQTMLFSATLEGGGVIKFANDVLNDPIKLEAKPPRKESNKIHQWIHLADSREHKLAILTHWLRDPNVTKAVVFVKTRERVNELVGLLGAAQLSCCWLQGDMPQDKRLQSIDKFNNNKVKTLVATDVAARGIDVDDISHVFNFDMPRTADVYVHRIGRTGRAGKKGTAISFVEAHEAEILGKVERYTQQKLKRRAVEGLEPKNKEAKPPAKKKKPKSKPGVTRNRVIKGKQKKAAKRR
ncbi:ATP-dependent RNA helicase SrmB [Saccharobesus litoralis]|uniref:ATP-dependent RNA helicase SrmB n=1 Tax=Saccharobesus litoralis TaxID=2172099 RepID=A0A2S0VVF5_9ALTE|nr:ATP-dependent RNA helicase SrmB [Saccharobesus litoralis]AWB68199.1 ATP-dependent RNA helicase SrmB [Saccharobesus litoralis]